jgi:septal ring factor EnvC (AmiA/AmiB activator)
MSEPTSPAFRIAAAVIVLLLPATVTWTALSSAWSHQDETEARSHLSLQRRLDRQERELEELRATVESQAAELRAIDRELDQMEEAFNDPD